MLLRPRIDSFSDIVFPQDLVEISYQLASPLMYKEMGLKFQKTENSLTNVLKQQRIR